MTLKDKFVRQDVFRDRKRLGPLGWLSLVIVALFVLACIVGAYQLLTHNVSRLEEPRALEATTTPEVAASNTTVATLAISNPITWTVWAAQDPLGQPIYEGTPEIKAWVLRDYRADQEWFNAHLLEKDYLLEHLAEYYTGPALADGRRNIERAFSQTFVIMAPPIAQPRQRPPMDQPRFVTFSQDGRQARVNDYTDAGPAKQYDTRTRKLMPVTLKNAFLWQYLLDYDPESKRWKISRNTQVININTNVVVFSDEP